MLSFIIGLVVGLVILIWSADKFVDGASAVATRMGMSRLLVGMIIVGFGTSAPEMVVSALSAYDGMPGIALGNAYGSNIANIALILGLTVLILPLRVEKVVVTREIPILLAISVLSMLLLWDSVLSRLDAIIFLVVFAGIMGNSIYASIREKNTAVQNDVQDSEEEESAEEIMPMGKAIMWLILGLFLLIASSRLLVWSAVGIATDFGVSEVIIGLTVVAIGTSLPELASAIAATKKKEHDLVIGNILGSNLFNTLAVVGIAGAIHPLDFDPIIVTRDLGINLLLTLLLFLFCMRAVKQKDGLLSRFQGFFFVAMYVLYTCYLISIVLGKPLFDFSL